MRKNSTGSKLGVPCAKVTYIRGGKEEVVEFPQISTKLDWFVCGMCVVGAIFSLAYMVWRTL